MPRVRVLMDTRRGERTFAARPASASPLPPAGRRATRGGATRRRCGAARWSSSSRSRQSPRRARPSSCRTRSIGSSRSGGRASSPPARGKPVGVGGRVVKRSVAPTHLLHRLVGRCKGEVGSRVTITEPCKYYKLTSDNNGEAFRWTSNYQIIKIGRASCRERV